MTGDASAVISVGSIVRAERRKWCNSNNEGQEPGALVNSTGSTTSTTITRGRAMVATMTTNTGSTVLSLLWEDIAPSPLQGMPDFIVAPMPRQNTNTCYQDFEVDGVSVKSVSLLLPFETSSMINIGIDLDTANKRNQLENILSIVRHYKKFGDELLKLKDPTSALSYYEAALSATSCGPSVGGTVIVNIGGFPTLADVDCINSEDDGFVKMNGDRVLASNTVVDLTFIDVKTLEERECTMIQRQILLCLLRTTASAVFDDTIQERILLNMARCLLLLSEVEADLVNMGRMVRSNGAFLKSAVLSCSLALCCTLHREHHMINCSEGVKSNTETNSSSTAPPSVMAKTDEEMGRYLRARAYVKLNKFHHAKLDLRYILSKQPRHRASVQLLEEIKRKETQKKRLDKKLAKDVCHWVQRASNNDEDDQDCSNVEGKVKEYNCNSKNNSEVSGNGRGDCSNMILSLPFTFPFWSPDAVKKFSHS